MGYITLGTNNLEQAGKFYDELLAELGASRTIEDERMLGWQRLPADPMFSVITPYNEQIASVGNGVMISLDVGTP